MTSEKVEPASASAVPAERQGWRRHLRFLPPILFVLVALLAVFAIAHLAREVTYQDVADALGSTPPTAIALAVLLTGASFFALTFYDVSALTYAGQRVPYPVTALTSFCAYAVGNTAGFGALSGGAIRYRFYTPYGVEPEAIGKIIAFTTVAFGFGLVATTGAGLMLADRTIAAPAGLNPEIVRIVGAVLLVAVAVLVGLCAVGRGTLHLGRFAFPVPPAPLVIRQLVVTVLDILASAAVLHVLLPEGAISYPAFVAVYAVAIGLAVLSHVPAGLGVFETVIVAGIGHAVPVEAILGALVLYRLIYHALPLFLAAILVGIVEIRRARAGANASRTIKVAGRLAAPVLGAVTFVSGGMLVVSGVTPIPESRIATLDASLPTWLLESAHFLSSILGVFLLVAARGIAFRLDGAWWAAMLTIALALALTPVKALAVGEAAILATVLVLLLLSRRAFNRPTSLLQQPMTAGWLAAIATVVIAAAGLLFFAYKDVAYTDGLWWQFEISAEAPRSLRAAVGIAIAAAAIALWSLLRPAAGRPERPSADDIARAAAIVDAQDKPDGNLVRMGDKSLLFSADGRAFLMYARQSRSWIALFDPVGHKEAFPELIWRFVEMARQHGGRAVFYEVSALNLALYADAGLLAYKLGEDARVPLGDFSLAGPKRAPLRHALNRGEREGLTFAVVGPAEIPGILDEIEAISRGWLAEHKAREKRFSLGAFDRAYVASQPVALLRKNGRTVAFATVMVTERRGEATIDIMRFSQDAPPGAMDVLFLKLIEHFKAEGYAFFNLGMAPLSGFADSPAAPIWSRIARQVFEHGEALYNFKGLRSFKAKFQPEWQPKYMAVAGGFNPVFALADATILISGGVRGVVGK